MESEITLTFSLPPAGLRRNHEANRYTANALKDAYSETMYHEWIRQGAPTIMRPMREGEFDAEVVWNQCGTGDTDNCLSALKPMFDVLGMAPVSAAGANRYYLGWYESDSQIKRITVERERVSKKALEGVTITLRAR